MANELLVNASPLIVLTKIGLFWVLPRLATTVSSTRLVIDEVLRKDDDAARAVATAMPIWLRVIPVEEPAEDVAETLRRHAIDEGESSLLSVAAGRRECEVVLDDLAARKAAKTLGVRVVGTLGLIVRANRNGLITDRPAIVPAIMASGLRVTPILVRWLEAELAD